MVTKVHRIVIELHTKLNLKNIRKDEKIRVNSALKYIH